MEMVIKIGNRMCTIQCKGKSGSHLTGLGALGYGGVRVLSFSIWIPSIHITSHFV